MKPFVEDMLKTKLSPFYYYHNVHHTLYVYDKVIEIGQQENCSEKEIALLKAAALWHDTGFINSYANHEKESCILAQRYLPEFGYPPADINTICRMIMATRMPQSPQNKAETILADADLEYLGSAGVEEKAEDLYKELQHLNPSLTKAQWLKTQISFLQAHRYFTRFCKENRQPAKQVYLNKLVSQLV